MFVVFHFLPTFHELFVPFKKLTCVI
jgi:hypothetical protein